MPTLQHQPPVPAGVSPVPGSRTVSLVVASSIRLLSAYSFYATAATKKNVRSYVSAIGSQVAFSATKLSANRATAQLQAAGTATVSQIRHSAVRLPNRSVLFPAVTDNLHKTKYLPVSLAPPLPSAVTLNQGLSLACCVSTAWPRSTEDELPISKVFVLSAAVLLLTGWTACFTALPCPGAALAKMTLSDTSHAQTRKLMERTPKAEVLA